MKYILNKAYDTKLESVVYDTETVYCYDKVYKNRSSHKKDFPLIGNSMESLMRKTTLTNRLLTFWYFTHSKINGFDELINTVNNCDMTIADIPIRAEKAVIRDIYSTQVSTVFDELDNVVLNKVFITIEIEDEYPLLNPKQPRIGFFFKNPKTNTFCRVQYSSTPEEYIGVEQYPYAVQVVGGFGFYSEDRPDLNSTTPVFLTSDGSIAASESEIEYVDCIERKTASWRGMGIPKECCDVGVSE